MIRPSSPRSSAARPRAAELAARSAATPALSQDQIRQRFAPQLRCAFSGRPFDPNPHAAGAPVIAPDGFTYRRDEIERWLETHGSSPPAPALRMSKGDLRFSYAAKNSVELLAERPEDVGCDPVTQTAFTKPTYFVSSGRSYSRDTLTRLAAPAAPALANCPDETGMPLGAFLVRDHLHEALGQVQKGLSSEHSEPQILVPIAELGDARVASVRALAAEPGNLQSMSDVVERGLAGQRPAPDALVPLSPLASAALRAFMGSLFAVPTGAIGRLVSMSVGAVGSSVCVGVSASLACMVGVICTEECALRELDRLRNVLPGDHQAAVREHFARSLVERPLEMIGPPVPQQIERPDPPSAAAPAQALPTLDPPAP